MATADLVDVDIYLTDPQPKWRLVVDRAQAALLGVDLGDLVATLNQGRGLSGCQLAAGARRQVSGADPHRARPR